jgi:hypothetical protein
VRLGHVLIDQMITIPFTSHLEIDDSSNHVNLQLDPNKTDSSNLHSSEHLFQKMSTDDERTIFSIHIPRMRISQFVQIYNLIKTPLPSPAKQFRSPETVQSIHKSII